MRRSFRFAALVAAIALLALPARAGQQPARPTAPAPSLSPASPRAPAATPPSASSRDAAHTLVVFTDYADRGVMETFDATTRKLLSRAVHGHTRGARAAGARAADAAGDVSASAPTAAQRCSNWNTYAPFDGGLMRPWRITEPWHMNSWGAPASQVGDWRNQIWNGKWIWETTRNSCGLGDSIIWEMPGGFDTGTPIVADCGQPDDENVIGFANLGGWGDGLVLARTCVWFNSGYIYESDMIFNVHPDAKWANGVKAGSWDLQSVAAHEFGHALGLGHVETSANQDTATAVMHPVVYRADIRNRTLSRGDIDGAVALYPRRFGFELLSATLENPAGAGQRLEPEGTYSVVVEVLNRGYGYWYVGHTGSVVVSTYPSGRCSRFVAADWNACSLPSVIDEDATDAGGGPENGTGTVAQGEIARYRFSIPVRWADEGTMSWEAFTITGLPVSDPGQFTIPIDVGTIKATLTDTSGPGYLLENVVVGGFGSTASVTIRNDGTAPWRMSSGRFKLVTDPAGRESKYKGSDWFSKTVASGIDRPAEGFVLPGQTATFSFGFSTPLNASGSPRYATEAFDVEVAGRPIARLGTRAVFRFEIW